MLPLFPFQADAVRFLLSRKRSLLALDTGLGKTRCSIEVVNADVSIKKVLVICPAFLRPNWAREIEKWGKECIRVVSWKIVSYQFCVKEKNLEALQLEKYDLLICDEAHYLKNWNAKRTKNILLKLAPKIQKIILATATPYIKSAQDLHPLYSTCQPGEWGKYKDFSERYCIKRWNPWAGYRGAFEYVGVNVTHVDELREKSEPCTYKKLKHEVEKQLPEKIVARIPIKVGTELQLKELGFSREQAQDMVLSGGCTEELAANRRKLGVTKVPVAAEWADSLPGNTPCVFFVWHREVGELLVKELAKISQPSPRLILGGMSSKLREAYIHDFMSGMYQFLVASIGACGVGVNLHHASTACFVEFPWSAAELKQCEDRLHRIGQKKCVNIYHLVAQNTLDDLVLDILERKTIGANLSVGAYE